MKPPVHRPAGAKSVAAVKRELDRERPSASRRGYGPRWRRARAAFLSRNPLCAACEAQGRVVPATVVDHVVPHRGDQKLFWDETNWAATCKPCHDGKTAREGRWGQRNLSDGSMACRPTTPGTTGGVGRSWRVCR
jgi:5-methylcytosine-specific restriction protein A